MTSRPLCVRGITLIETVVGMAMTAFIALAVAQVVSLTSHVGQHLLTTTNAHLAQQKVTLLVHSALNDLERSRLSMGALIVDEGALQAIGHPLVSLRGTSSPRPASDVMSVVELSLLHRGTVTYTHMSGREIELKACGFGEVPTSDRFRSFVALGPERAVSVIGSMVRTSTACGSFTGRLAEGPFGEANPQPQGFIALWPVVREYSLFVDRSGQFRMVSHVGQRILENQPIIRGLRTLRVIRQEDPLGVEGFWIEVRASGAAPLRSLTPRLFLTRGSWNELAL